MGYSDDATESLSRWSNPEFALPNGKMTALDNAAGQQNFKP